MARWGRAVLLGCLLLLAADVAAAQGDRVSFEALDLDMEFVDTQGDSTGYYVDLSQARYINLDEAVAWVEIVRADANRLYLYEVRFNRGQQHYVIQQTTIAEYDSKHILRHSETPLPLVSYTVGSPMDNVAAYLYEHCPSAVKSTLTKPTPPPIAEPKSPQPAKAAATQR